MSAVGLKGKAVSSCGEAGDWGDGGWRAMNSEDGFLKVADSTLRLPVPILMLAFVPWPLGLPGVMTISNIRLPGGSLAMEAAPGSWESLLIE